MTARAHEAGTKVEAILLQRGSNISGLHLLENQGWQEDMPDPECWNFSHKDYPGVRVRWFFHEAGWSVSATDYRSENSENWDRYVGKFHPKGEKPDNSVRPSRF